MNTLSRVEKFERDRIERCIKRAYRRNCTGLQIDIRDIRRVSDEGKKLIAEGADDEALGKGLKAFTETIAHKGT
jgi:hypothetical protein